MATSSRVSGCWVTDQHRWSVSRVVPRRAAGEVGEYLEQSGRGQQPVIVARAHLGQVDLCQEGHRVISAVRPARAGRQVGNAAQMAASSGHTPRAGSQVDPCAAQRHQRVRVPAQPQVPADIPYPLRGVGGIRRRGPCPHGVGIGELFDELRRGPRPALFEHQLGELQHAGGHGPFAHPVDHTCQQGRQRPHPRLDVGVGTLGILRRRDKLDCLLSAFAGAVVVQAQPHGEAPIRREFNAGLGKFHAGLPVRHGQARSQQRFQRFPVHLDLPIER